ncbi:MAG TPA: ALQxL family class IV lanthipeptide, partial [Pseudonocardiaceae bacterium]|nr:ALQxL family class IV lanthipeptide [Pseudonocardiaceae bacterium]
SAPSPGHGRVRRPWLFLTEQGKEVNVMEIDVDLLQMLPADEPGGLLLATCTVTTSCTCTTGSSALLVDEYDSAWS